MSDEDKTTQNKPTQTTAPDNAPANAGATEPAPFPNNLPLEDQVKEALRAVNDPEIGLNVVQLGLIREINLNQDEPEIKMMLTTPFCPYGGWLIQQVKDTAEQLVGKQIKIDVLPDLWDPNFMEDPGLLMGW